MPRTVKWLTEVWDDLLIYAVTLLGVMVSQYLPAMKSGQDFQIEAHWSRILVGAVIALAFVLKDEELPAGQDKTVARQGKRRNLRRRLSSGLAQGMMWSTLSGAVS